MKTIKINNVRDDSHLADEFLPSSRLVPWGEVFKQVQEECRWPITLEISESETVWLRVTVRELRIILALDCSVRRWEHTKTANMPYEYVRDMVANTIKRDISEAFVKGLWYK